MRSRARLALVLPFLFLPTASAAQSLGTYRWQLSPFCNVVTATVAQTGGIYTLTGFDDQCGAGTRAPVTGTAVPNPDGSIGLGFTTVSTPGAAPVHVDAVVSLATVSGSWRDSHGRSGAFLFNPVTPASGAPRPAVTRLDPSQVQQRLDGRCNPGWAVQHIEQNGQLNCVRSDGDITAVTAGFGLAGGSSSGDVALSVDAAFVQRRVGGSCGAGSSIRAIASDGTLTCELDDVGAGDITSVTPGFGLTGGSASGDAMLSVNFGGTGSAAVAARSDHTHARSGSQNTSVGANALASLTVGNENTAYGYNALGANTTGSWNVAVGSGALAASSGVNSSIAVGAVTLASLTSGPGNVAIGDSALAALTSGTDNIAIGFFAGSALTAGDDNLYLGSISPAIESATIRIGRFQNRFFTSGIRGVTTGQNNAMPVLVDGNGQLGMTSSTRRSKEAIEDLGAVGLLAQRLRPVQFQYREPFTDGSKPVQYGLIAEEVEAVLPELVAYGADGQPASVKYHILPTLLLAEIQRLERERVISAERTRQLFDELAALRAEVERMRGDRLRN